MEVKFTGIKKFQEGGEKRIPRKRIDGSRKPSHPQFVEKEK